jgi:hypothetical protein
MTLVSCAFYLLLIMLMGYGVISLIRPANRMSAVQLAGLVSAVGAGTMGLLLFWASLMGFVPSRKLLVILGGLTVAGLLIMRKRGRLVQVSLWTSDDQSNGWLVVPLMILGAGLALMAGGALSTPLAEWDALAIWGFKAKVVTYDALRPVPAYFHDLTFSYSHLDYPLMLPFLTAGAYAAMGTVDDHAGKLVSVFLDGLMVLVVYAGLRWKLRRLPAVCLCAVATLMPVTFRYAGIGCADLTLAMFYAGNIYFMAKWIEERRGSDLMLAILFGAFTAFTKNEGLVLALASGLVLLVFGPGRGRRRGWAGGVLFFAGLLVIHAPWLLWNSSLPRTHEDYGSKLLSPLLIARLPELKQIIPAITVPAAEFQWWGLFWVLAGVMALLGWRAFQRRYVVAVWTLLGLQLLSYAFVYSVTPWDLAVLIPLTLDRLLLQAVPAVILLIGWHWAEVESVPNFR